MVLAQHVRLITY